LLTTLPHCCDACSRASLRSDAPTAAADIVINNGLVSLTFDGATGLVKSYSNLAAGVTGVPLSHTLQFYNASIGNNVSGQVGRAAVA
jgi:hypothetical protein